MTGDGEGCQLYVVRIVCVLEREQVTKRVDSGPSAQQVPRGPWCSSRRAQQSHPVPPAAAAPGQRPVCWRVGSLTTSDPQKPTGMEQSLQKGISLFLTSQMTTGRISPL